MPKRTEQDDKIRIDALEKELREKENIVQQLRVDLNQFVNVASHDLREPINTITTFLTLFKRNYSDNLDEKGEKIIEFIAKASDRVNQLVSSLAAYALADNIIPEPVLLNDVLRVALSRLRTQYPDHHPDIVYPSLPLIDIDKEAARFLFFHLLENALKFHHQGKKSRIILECSKKEDGYEFEITDNGIGIPSAYLDQVFQPFTKLHSKSLYPGPGIGLAHCKKIIEAHGGTITLISEEGMGTTVRFFLPQSFSRQG